MIDLTFETPQLAPSLNGNGGLIRMHYRTYKAIRNTWTWCFLERKGELHAFVRFPLPNGCRVQIVRYYAYHALDLDNLYASAKVPLDALCRAGVLKDDDPESVYDLQCRQVKVGSAKEQSTKIRIAFD